MKFFTILSIIGLVTMFSNAAQAASCASLGYANGMACGLESTVNNANILTNSHCIQNSDLNCVLITCTTFINGNTVQTCRCTDDKVCPTSDCGDIECPIEWSGTVDEYHKERGRQPSLFTGDCTCGAPNTIRYRCAAGYYGDLTKLNSSCTRCPAFTANGPAYVNSNENNDTPGPAYGTSYAGSTVITACYIPRGNYEDNVGTFDIVDKTEPTQPERCRYVLF